VFFAGKFKAFFLEYFLKTVILCGGLGSRLAEETNLRPKPMVEIGDRPILWHIMKIYEKYGCNDFVLALGYKAEYIKDYFINYHARSSDITVHLNTGVVDYSNPTAENWNISLVDTGANTLTGGRLLRLKKYLYDGGTFMLTYGDGLADIDIGRLLEFHRSHGKIATVSAVRPSARFGGMRIENGCVIDFKEKPQSGEGVINGGFFVFETGIFDYLDGDSTILEQSPIDRLVKDSELMAYQHPGFWQCMDTIREKEMLQSLWESGNAPWIFPT
jgi:glucose-1-phosphate cytidylyltransferase